MKARKPSHYVAALILLLLPGVARSQEANGDLAIASHTLTQRENDHLLQVKVTNLGTDPFKCNYHMRLGAKVTLGPSTVFAEESTVITNREEFQPGTEKDFEFSVVNQSNGVALSDGNYELSLKVFNNGTYCDMNRVNNTVSELFAVGTPGADPVVGVGIASMEMRPWPSYFSGDHHYTNDSGKLFVTIVNNGEVSIDGGQLTVSFPTRVNGEIVYGVFSGDSTTVSGFQPGDTVVLASQYYQPPAGEYVVTAQLSGLGSSRILEESTLRFTVEDQRRPGTNGDLVIASHTLTQRENDHLLRVKVTNLGTDPLKCHSDMKLGAKVTLGPSTVFAEESTVLIRLEEFQPGTERDFEFSVVNQSNGVALSDGNYELSLQVLQQGGTWCEMDHRNNTVTEQFTVKEEAPAVPTPVAIEEEAPVEEPVAIEEEIPGEEEGAEEVAVDVTSTGTASGYAWANMQTSSSYPPSGSYSFNASGMPIVINRSGVGSYAVVFEGLGGNGQAGGNVQVTAYGNAKAVCNVQNWNSGGSDFIANVTCSDASGNMIDSRYSISVRWPPAAAEGAGSGYAWANMQTSSSYPPYGSYSFNASGMPIVINRSGVGSYAVVFEGLGGNGQAGGNVQVTAYGNAKAVCNVQNWNSGGSDFIAKVTCSDASGNMIDSRYSISVRWPPAAAEGAGSGYAWANNQTSSSYPPSGSYSFNASGMPIVINRSGVGSYAVVFEGLGGNGQAGGNVQVTAYGNAKAVCNVQNWNSGGSDFIANVTCSDASGNMIDSRYSISVRWPPATSSTTISNELVVQPSDEPVAQPGDCSQATTLAEEMTCRHNLVRATAEPSPDPPLTPLAWDEALAANAQTWADTCPVGHDPDMRGMNRNMAWGHPTAEVAVNGWASEAANYDYSTNSCSKQVTLCAHYKQIVSRNATRIGCGVKSGCTNRTSPVWVCNYQPGISFMDQPY